MLHLFEGGGETNGGVGIIAVIEDVVDMKGFGDEVSDSTLERGDIGNVLATEIIGVEVLLVYGMDTWAVEESGCLSDDENSGSELKSEADVKAGIEKNEDLVTEDAAIDTRVDDDIRKVRGGVGGPTPPRIGGKGTVLVLVCVTMAVTDVFAVGSNTPALAHVENEAK